MLEISGQPLAVGSAVLAAEQAIAKAVPAGSIPVRGFVREVTPYSGNSVSRVLDIAQSVGLALTI